ncbi:hypothetical protein [uncultured Mobiluncus sp.]|uniref:hypothetical protein n=1 Tax=uncultured Mobiluncus sp. TaxID=293425 RepID=UPI002621F625|nr:hypothetical protein [uncultured Mobiluncus sp.]
MSNPYNPAQFPPPQQPPQNPNQTAGQLPTQTTGQIPVQNSGLPPQQFAGAPNYYASQTPAQPNNDTSLGSWMLTIFLASLPIVGIVMLLIWSFGSGTSPAKSNWAKATLLWALIAIGIYVLLILLTGGLIIGGLLNQS